jgi:general secretion pathway protein G
MTGRRAVRSMEAHRDMNKYQRIGIRVAISTNVGVLVAAIAIVVAWRDIGDTNRVRSEQWATRQAISDIKKSLQMYRGAGKPPPKSLEEFRGPGGEFPAQFQRDERGRPLVDGWGRPFLYSVEGSEYVVTSLGRDGKPGGVGLDCDLSSLKEWPKEAVPTLGQVLGYPSTRGIICPCLACGVLAFLLSLATVNPRTIEDQGVFPLVVQIGVTILGVLFVAYFLSLVQIANYH